MKTPQTPSDESKRIETLRALKILDSEPEERFDRLTRLAKRMFGVSISLVSLVDSDRQWFKSSQGLDATETPRDISFCGHAILGDDVFTVPNALNDERFADNPLVTDAPNIRFYAGCPLTVANGSKLGTLCIIDQQPRDFSEEDALLLTDLAIMAEQEIAAIQLATLDELTLISNRRGFIALGQHALNICLRNKLPATVLLFDLDDFKPINDTFGHAEGDRALIAFANLMREIFRDSDVFGRIGGDEFVALLTNTEGRQTDITIARLESALNEYNQNSKRGYELKYSVGHASNQEGIASSIEELLEQADKQMYTQKHKRKSV
jgi:diguanylate cyclase (GGDEF)-like protein